MGIGRDVDWKGVTMYPDVVDVFVADVVVADVVVYCSNQHCSWMLLLLIVPINAVVVDCSD